MARMRFLVLCVCLMACALFGRTFGQENDFRELNAEDETQSVWERDLPFNPETTKACLDSVGFDGPLGISNFYKNPQSIASADFNADGSDDVVVAYATSNAVVLYTRNGNNWNSANLGTVVGASAVLAADFNGDGRVDIVAASETDNNVVWFRNTVSGWVRDDVGPATSPRSLFAADINGDLKLDIIAGGGEVIWFANNIQNTQPSSWTAAPPVSLVVDSVSAADINKDGFVDIVIASADTNEVAWLNNTVGDGTVFDKIVIATPNGPAEVFVTDMDDDGWQDVMTANYQGNSTTLYYNSIGGNHTLPAANNNSAPTDSADWLGIYVAENQDGPQSVFATDLDGNGDQEILVAITGANQVYYYQASVNNYTWEGVFLGNFTEPTSVFARDVDGSNAKDVIVASAPNNTVSWFKELCSTSPRDDGDDEHVVGWSVAGGVIGGLLILWLLLIIGIAIRDYIKHQTRKEFEKNSKKEAKAMLPGDEEL